MTLAYSQQDEVVRTPPVPNRIALLNDYVRIPYANGSSFASQFLYRELGLRGAEVTVVGPHDPEARAQDLPPRHVQLPALPLRNHPGVHLALPSKRSLLDLAGRNFDLVLAQTSNALIDVGVWLRQTRQVPLMMVNTVHLPSVYNTLLPDFLDKSDAVHWAFREHLVPFAERNTVDAYNRGDGLVVLSPGLKRYWRERGVTAPIHVIGRAIDRTIWDREPGADPFPASASKGNRLLVVCRHVREKGLARLIDLFAKRILPARPSATLTLVGDGPDHEVFKQQTEKLRVTDKVFFVGERPVTEMVTWYAHADLFVYTSLSETYGQVVGEALWCGLPVVGFQDDMGVSGQVTSGVDGELVAPGPDQGVADAQFSHAVLRLLADPKRRMAYGEAAGRGARDRADPTRTVTRYLEAFAVAKEHCLATPTVPSRREELHVLGRWTGIHSLVLALGLLRAPARVPRNTTIPSWVTAKNT